MKHIGLMISESGNITGISKLPAEVLSVVFKQCIHCPTFLSFSSTQMPAQIVISHVCMSWRYVALGARNLWANVGVRVGYSSRNQQVYNAWLARAGQHPISLVLNCRYYSEFSDKLPIPPVFWRFVKRFPVRRLRLLIYIEDFCDLWASGGQDALPYLERLDIDIQPRGISDSTALAFNMIPAAVIGKIHSAAFTADGLYLHRETVEWTTRQLALPWAQLRDLEIDACMLLSWYITVLQQMPLIEQYHMNVSVDEAAENMGHLTLSHLQSLTISFLESEDHVDGVIRHFTCPNLTLLDIEDTSDCSTATWDMIRKQYNLHRLQDLSITLLKPFFKNLIPSSVIFRDAPMIRNLNVEDIAIIDEETCVGMVIGAFGRLLRSLEVSCKRSDVGVVLGMAKDHQLAVAEILRPGPSWQEEMASLKQLTLNYFSSKHRLGNFDDEIIELKRLGVAVTTYKTKAYNRGLIKRSR